MRRVNFVAGLGLVICLVGSILAASPARANGTPSLRLIASQENVELFRGSRTVEFYALPVYVAAVGGEVQLNASRPGYGPWKLDQVDPGGAVLRSLPPEFLDMGANLNDFFKVSFLNKTGETAASKKMDFCPDAYDRQRLNDEGPRNTRFPIGYGCYDTFPFVRGMVAGIDEGWAVNGFENSTPMVVPKGKYTLRVEVTQPYRDAFEIPDQDAVAELSATVRRGIDGGPVKGGGKGRRQRALTTHDHSSHTHQSYRPSPFATQGSLRAATPIDTNPDPSTLPDLTASPAWNIRAERQGGRDLLTFAATTWNEGPSTLITEGFRPNAQTEVMSVFQYFRNPTTGQVTGKAPAGRMHFHRARGHNHWHLKQFARYSLLGSDKSSIEVSRKQSFCIVPTDAVDLTVPGAVWQPSTSDVGGTICGEPRSLWIRETLESGWGDTYHQSVAGQALNISDLPNGRYFIEVTVNPSGKLYDVSADNDSTLRRVRIGGKPGARTVRVAPWRGITE